MQSGTGGLDDNDGLRMVCWLLLAFGLDGDAAAVATGELNEANVFMLDELLGDVLVTALLVDAFLCFI